MNQIIIGYTTEGTTDMRFLESIIQRTFEKIAFECNGQIEVLPLIHIKKDPGLFVEKVLECTKAALTSGVLAFCIHIDADSNNTNSVYSTKLSPLLSKIEAYRSEDICKNIVPVIPVHMSEAWMLADKALLKEEIGTALPDNELGINRDPETIADPKNVIEAAIRTARQGLPKRRRDDLQIGELYLPIGQKISIEKLCAIPSFSAFVESVRSAYRKINYLQ